MNVWTSIVNGEKNATFHKKEASEGVPVIFEIEEGLWWKEGQGYKNLQEEKGKFCATRITPIWPTHQKFWWEDKMGLVVVVFIIETTSTTCWSSMPMGAHEGRVIEHHF